MKRKTKITIIAVAVIIIISNLPPVTYFFQEEYHYRNQDASFEFTEQGGSTQDYEVAIARFEIFKARHPAKNRDTLYRTFKFKPWRFWEWWEMITNYQKYDLPIYENRSS